MKNRKIEDEEEKEFPNLLKLPKILVNRKLINL